MTTDTVFRIAFWFLLAGVLAVRIFFAAKVRRAGERVMPDRQAAEREGRGMFALRVLLFLLLLAWLALYAIHPTWMEALSVPFPDWLRWLGFILGLAGLALWAWTQVALGKEWSPKPITWSLVSDRAQWG